VSATLNLALWGALYRRLDGLPERIFALARRQRAADQARALTVLQEMAAARVGPLVQGLRVYHEQLDADLRGRIAAAELRARVTERSSSEAGVALSAASTLVRELRALLDGVTGLAAPAVGEARDARDTVETAPADSGTARKPRAFDVRNQKECGS
jgi:hypothetical protein